MKKKIKKLITITLVVATMLGYSLTTFAYDVPISDKDMMCGTLSLSPTPVYYETSKYPEINLDRNTGYISKLKSDMKPKRVGTPVFNLYYDKNIDIKQYSSGMILLGAKLNYDKILDNSMACLKLNRIDMTGTYVATYDIDAKYNAIVRLEPSYSVFGNKKDIQLKYRINPVSCDCVFYVEFKVYDELLMDDFHVTIKSTDGKDSYTVKADVLNYYGANPYSSEDIASEGRAIIKKSASHMPFTITDKTFDVYFNNIKVASNVKTSDFRLDPYTKSRME